MCEYCEWMFTADEPDFQEALKEWTAGMKKNHPNWEIGGVYELWRKEEWEKIAGCPWANELYCSLTAEICKEECEEYKDFCCGGCLHDEAHSPWKRGDKPARP